MSTVITVENLGKKYTLHHQQREQYTALRDVISNGVASLGNKLIHPFRRSLNPQPSSLIPKSEDFWALKDVSFEVKQGDRIGIIGRNGAGKSTLLKILSRITEPTTGSVRIKGRVASLLEVGTGFHPELTGRENIYLNGAILGMGRAEIKKKFDEIVDFAEIEKFLDTPVKRYSSGMYVRLAFAVAAHLEPEILIIDEVLAVGDSQFQKKCLGKMEDVSAKEGRTVLFVSHNMAAIESLCSKALLIASGNVTYSGYPIDAISRYFHAKTGCEDLDLVRRQDRSGSGKLRVEHFSVCDFNGRETSALFSGYDYTFKIGYSKRSEDIFDEVVVSLDIVDENMFRVLMLRTNFTNDNLRLKSSKGVICCRLNDLPLAKGTYRFNLFVSYKEVEILDYIENVFTTQVIGGDFFGTGSEGMPSHCKTLTRASWWTEFVE
jgi:lipopolysaccharide transport system ATP-binding protein